MMKSLNQLANELKIQLEQCSRVRITTHKSPDGDALGSLIAFSYICSHFGKDFDMILDDDIPANLTFLPRSEKISRYNETDVQQLLENEQTDLVVFVDCGQRSRSGFVEQSLRPSQFIVNIDHHHMNPNYGDLNIISNISSTAELIFLLMEFLNIPISKECAEALFAGIMTDTGSFTFEKSDSGTFNVASKLVAAGAVPINIHQKINQSLPIEWFTLVRVMLEHIQVFFDGRLVVSYISLDDIQGAGGVDMINNMLPLMSSVETVEIYVLIKERSDHTISVSIRSKNDTDVSKIASHFGGGGHKRAAACRFDQVTMNEFREWFIPQLCELVQKELV
ncbi:MAG: DHH family phosphoesterase [Brevinema sp.]